LERISLRGICRTHSISLPWLLAFIVELYDQLPDHLYLQPTSPKHPVKLLLWEVEVDEMRRFALFEQHYCLRTTLFCISTVARPDLTPACIYMEVKATLFH
jgi:hypothetical protein